MQLFFNFLFLLFAASYTIKDSKFLVETQIIHPSIQVLLINKN